MSRSSIVILWLMTVVMAASIGMGAGYLAGARSQRDKCLQRIQKRMEQIHKKDNGHKQRYPSRAEKS